jgi:hypothetical protein
MKSNMNDVTFFIGRSIHIAEALNPLLGVNVDVTLVELAECLQLLRSAPGLVGVGSSHHGIEGFVSVVRRRRCWDGSTGGASGRRRSSSRRPTLSADGRGELDEVVAVLSHVMGDVIADLSGMGPFTK